MTKDEQDLFKVSAEVALKPLSNLVERLFGGAVDEIGGEWRDRLRARRLERRLKLYRRLKEKFEAAGVNPRELPEKLWLPALEAISNEDDETLQEKWANLLANAAMPSAWDTPPLFVDILRQMSSPDVRLLWSMHRHGGMRVMHLNAHHLNPVHIHDRRNIGLYQLYEIWHSLGYAPSGTDVIETKEEWDSPTGQQRKEDLRRFYLSIDNLIRLGLILKDKDIKIETPKVKAIQKAEHYSGQELKRKITETYRITDLGYEFVLACSDRH